MAGSSSAIVVARGVVKAITLAVGGLTTVLCLMSAIGHFTANGWVRVLGAVVLAVLGEAPHVLAAPPLARPDPVAVGGDHEIGVGDGGAAFKAARIDVAEMTTGTVIRSENGLVSPPVM